MAGLANIALNYDYKLKINTTPKGTTKTMAEINKGFNNLSKALNEALWQGSFLGDGGWGSTYVTGGQMTFTLTGVRIIGDAAQDYIFSDAVKNNFGSARATDFEIGYPNGDKLTGDVTLAKITEGGGDSGSPDAITVEIHFNGKPTLTPAVAG